MQQPLSKHTETQPTLRCHSTQLRNAAVLLSLLLHALLLAVPTLRGKPDAPAVRRLFQVVELRQQVTPPAAPVAKAPSTAGQKAIAAATTPIKRLRSAPPLPASAEPQSPADSKPQMQDAQPATAATSAPSISFTESARAAAGAAGRAVQSEAWQQDGVLRPKEAHRNLKKPEEELTTALGRDFEKRFGAEVVLSVEERQDGMERMTIVRTNKGMRCGYTRLINPQYMGNFPIVTRWGDCAKTS